MSIFVNSDTKVICQGFTGKNGTFHSEAAIAYGLSLIHISEPTRRRGISYAVFCLKKKKI